MEHNAASDPRPLTSQSLFRRLYDDPWVIVLQLLIGVLIAGDYVLNDRLLRTTNTWFIVSLALSGLLFFAPKLPFGKFTRSYVVHVVFHFITALFIVYVAPVGSPYELILLLLLYMSIHWYGARGYWLSLAAITGTLVMAVAAQIGFQDPAANYELFIKLSLLFLLGGLMQRMHAVDLQERKQLLKISREVSYERQRLRSLINSMADAVLATDYDGKILVYNGAALDLLNTNLTLDDQPLKRILKIYSKTHRRLDLLAEAKEAQAIIKRDDILLKVSQDEYLNLYASAAQIHLGYGEHGEEGFIFLLRDITKEKSIEEQRDEFISVVSHELRTPIAIAEANISTAMLPTMVGDKAKVAELLEQSHKNVLFLADLVNDITTLAHAERGDLDAEIEDVDPAGLVRDIAESYEQEIQTKGLKLKTVIAEGLPTVRSNNYRLKEILTDFMTNALKYTDKGTITLSVEMGSSGGIHFAVTDSGIGISQSDQRHVFGKFWRSEDYRTRVHSGTGLGLYIAKKLAERMHGMVGVESKLNKGSTFYLDIPLDIAEAQSGKAGK